MHTVTTNDRPVQAWQKAFLAFLPSLPTAGLEALATALAEDDERLLQGATTFPPPLHVARDMPVCAACAVSLALWRGHGLTTVGDVEEAFALACAAASERTGDPTGARYFLNWYDETPRPTMRRELLAEVNLALADREAVAA
jgi:hypothetical protein